MLWELQRISTSHLFKPTNTFWLRHTWEAVSVKLKEERLCWVSRRHRGRRGCKYSWPSCQRAAPLCCLLSLHWSLIHGIHVQWPPSLTSIMKEEVPFSPTCLMSVPPEEGSMLISPYILGFLHPLHHRMHNAGWKTFWRSFLHTLHFMICISVAVVADWNLRFWCPCFINLPWLYLPTNLREVSVWTSFSVQKCKSCVHVKISQCDGWGNRSFCSCTT